MESLTRTHVATLVVFGVIAIVTGCHAHLQLPSPPKTTAQEDAVSAYRMAMRPVARGVERKTTVLIDSETLAEVGRRTKSREKVTLGNGMVVYYVEDLVRVVGRESACGVAALKAADARNTNDAWGGGAAAFAFGGLFLALSHPEARLGLDLNFLSVPVSLSALAAASAAAGSLVVVAVTNGEVIALTDQAFECYEKDFSDMREESVAWP